MKSLVILLAAVAAATLSGCAAGTTRNGVGLLYTDTKDAIAVTSNSAATKRGESCATNVLSMVSTGDLTIEAAKRAGGITKVSHVDYSQYSILGLFAKTCTIVQGE